MFDKLFEPIKIGPVEIKNRIAEAPMNQMGDREGHPTLQYTCYYNARALGGFGLMTTGSIITSKAASTDEYPFVPRLYKGSLNFGYYVDFVESIHSQGKGAKIFAQLSPGFGRQTGRPNARGASPIAFDQTELIAGLPRKQAAWARYWLTDWSKHLTNVPRALTAAEIKEDQKNFIWAAERTILFGFDGIEIHACHGYMLHEFLSPRTNQRTDEYGGSLENRARYVLELVRLSKKSFGDAVPIVVRMSGREYQPDGITPEDMRQVAKWCEEAGADAIDLSNGSGYDDSIHFFPPWRDNLPLLEAQGRKLKQVIKIPVITPGFTTPEVAEKAVIEGDTDIVSLGRQAIADPEWPNKVKEGRLKDIIRCDRCDFCVGLGVYGGMAGCRCTQNPNYMKEQFVPEYWPKPMKGHVPDTLRRWKPGLRWQPGSAAWHQGREAPKPE